jgi:hypothetical protein
MADVAMYIIKHIKRLIRVIVDYSKAKGNLIAFYIEPITAHLLELIDDEEFNEDNFLTYHFFMPNSQSSPSSKIIEQDTPLTSNLSELSKNVRSCRMLLLNVPYLHTFGVPDQGQTLDV